MNTTTCIICNSTVTKRKTLDIGNGQRACRNHQETLAFLAEQERRVKEQALRNDVGRKFKVMMAVEAIRVFHTARRMPLAFLLANCRRSLKDDALYAEIEREVLANPTLSGQEIATAIATWAVCEKNARGVR